MTAQDYSVLYYESSINKGGLDNCFIEDLFEDEGPFGEADCAGL